MQIDAQEQHTQSDHQWTVHQGALDLLKKTAKNYCKNVRLKNEKVAIFGPLNLLCLITSLKSTKK